MRNTIIWYYNETIPMCKLKPAGQAGHTGHYYNETIPMCKLKHTNRRLHRFNNYNETIPMCKLKYPYWLQF